MKMLFLTLATTILMVVHAFSQQKTYKIRTIAFYNVENLFDTINDPLKFDYDRTPEGKDKWTSKHYWDKVKKIAKVLSDIGSEKTSTSPDITGLGEIENEQAMIDVINDPSLVSQNYSVIHFDSPDARGIDVGQLYKKDVFVPMSFKNYRLDLHDDNGQRDYTRDQLLASGFFDGEEMHFLVNHWPSRRGGEARSRPKREAAARLNKKIIDSLLNTNPEAKIISMGDLNDDPTNSSMKKVLKTVKEIDSVTSLDIYNPMEKMARKGMGSLRSEERRV